MSAAAPPIRVEPADWAEILADVDRPQLIVAGPGTGKTTFLARRAAHLMDDLGVEPSSLLILTFSRRGAARLRRRIDESVARSTSGLHASTFHSLAFRLLETHAEAALGWEAMPSLLTSPEQVALVAELLELEDRSGWPRPFAPLLTTRSFAEEVADFIMRSQEHLLDDRDLADRVAERGDWRGLDRFRRLYLDTLVARSRIDYGTLQAQAVRALADAAVQAAVTQRYRYVLVDEYQDTTPAQARLLELLVAGHRHITAAADPMQSIYSFRGAEPGNVAQFADRFCDGDGTPARRYELAHSFRVPASILEAATALVAGSADRPNVSPAPHTGRLEAYVFHQQSQEAEWIAAQVQQLHVTEGTPYREMAVLVRSKRRFLPELSRALDRRSIPHESPDSRMADHPAVRIIFDLVTVAVLEGPGASPGGRAEADRAVRRLLLGPLLAVALGTERELIRDRRRTDDHWATVLTRHLPDLQEIAELLARPAWTVDRSAADAFWHLWSTVPQFAPLALDPAMADFRRAWSSLSQALNRQHERDPDQTLATYVLVADQDDFEATPLLSYRDEPHDRLTLTTLHQAKGLEFQVAFIADAVEGVFPDLRRSRSLLQPRLLSHHQPSDPGEAALFRLAEERRLAYTAMTRASRRVVWTATKAGIDEAERRPSRFIAAVYPGEPGLPESDDGRSPVTPFEAESHLRRTLADPLAGAGKRLAAAHMLVENPARRLRDPRAFSMVRERGRDTGLIGDHLTLSPSQATSYDACPRRYAFERRLRVTSEFGRYATFGSLIHDVLERAERQAIEHGAPRSTIDEALELLERLFDEYDFEGGARRIAWYQRAIRLLVDLYDHWIRPDARAVLVEHDLEMDIDGIRWRGRADRIEQTPAGELRVVDYKTSGSAPSKQDAAVSIQLAFYLAAAKADPRVTGIGPPTEAEFWYPAAKRATKWLALDAAKLDDVLDTMRDIADGIAAEDWTPRLGAGCDRCTVRWVCPLWPEGREAFVR
ncbi:MAG: ATP-dependent helicase [Acidimicrobiia bacterium]|nr:ATP-dependent helicase [Acidimicrobiia bacterium]